MSREISTPSPPVVFDEPLDEFISSRSPKFAVPYDVRRAGWHGKPREETVRAGATPGPTYVTGHTTWRPSIALGDGIASAYEWFLANLDNTRDDHAPAETSSQ